MSHYLSDIDGVMEQGDILGPVKIKEWLSWWEDDKEYPIVLMTPACDLAQERADYHRFCILQPFPLMLYEVGKQANLNEEHWSGQLEVGKNKADSITKKLGNLITNSWPRYHFLPKSDGVFRTERFIDFELIGTIPLDSVANLPRIARVNSPYKEELIHRFSHHIMRIGTPDYDETFVNELIASSLAKTDLKIAS